MKPLTKDQIRASDPGASVWVSASAGTGKTHVLAARFLRLLLRGSDPSVILSLTYTRAAANEMSLRIYDELGAWPTLGDKELAASIARHAGEKPDQAMLERARTLFGLVLDSPGGLKIQTIHAFCQSILRRFPIEAGLSPGFEIMDDRTASELKTDAVEHVYTDSRRNPGSPYALALRKIASEISEFSFENLLKAVMDNQRAIHRHLQLQGGLRKFERAIRRALKLEPGETRSGISENFCSDLLARSEPLTRLSEWLSTGNVGEAKWAAALSALLAAEMRGEDCASYVEDYARTLLADMADARKRRPRKNLLSKKNVERHPEAVRILEEEGALVIALLDRLDRQALAENTTALVTLAERIFAYYRSLKRQRGFLDYDDLIEITDRLFQQPGLAPWILYKLDHGIDHILIDEAQDTNRTQWRLLEAISNEFFAGKGASEKLRTMFAVGDVKQSIFRFQGAAPREFVLARERVREKTRAVMQKFGVEELNMSFRSTEPILTLVDEVFKNPEAAEGLGFENKPIEHRAFRSGQAGRVELWPAEKPDPADWSESWPLPVRQRWQHSGEAKVANRIGKKIQTMLDKGEVLESRNRQVRPGDFLILVRRRTRFVEFMVRDLKARNVPVSGADRMVLNDQLVVEDLIALGAFVLLPGDDLNLACLLKSPIIGFDDDQLFELAHGREKQSLWQRLQQKSTSRKVFGEALDLLKGIMAVADFEAPFEFFSNFLNRNQMRLKLARRLGSEINDPIDEFLNLSLQYQMTHAPSLQGFLHWITVKETEIKRDLDRGRNEVRIMTIHGAKGLEAPIVFMPDTCSSPSDKTLILDDLKTNGNKDGSGRTGRMLYWAARRKDEPGPAAAARDRLQAEELAEFNRLLYVALTRAEDRLYITGWETSKNRPAGSWYDHIERAFDRLPGVVEIKKAGDYRVRQLKSEQSVQAKPQKTDDFPMGPAPLLPAWVTSAPKPEKVPLQPLMPSASGDSPAADRSPLQKEAAPAAQRGIIIHQLLEHLPGVAPRKRADLAARFLAQPALRLSPEDQTTVSGSLMTVLDHEDFGKIFGPLSRAEVPVVGVLAGKTVSGRIDRLVVDENQILIVDYKSSQNPPDNQRDIPQGTVRQLAIYKAILGKIYPGKTVKAALLWTETATLMEVRGSILEEVLKAALEAA